MADILTRATGGMVPTGGSLITFTHTRAPTTMTAIETNAQRLTVVPYRVNHGQFLPKYPLINLAASFYGVISSQLDASWTQIADKGVYLWDAGDAGLHWLSDPAGKFGALAAVPGSIKELLPGMHADRSSKRAYPVVRTNPGAMWRGMVENTRNGWAAVAFRIIDDRSNGPVMSLELGGSAITVETYGDYYRVLVDGAIFTSHTRDHGDSYTTVIGVEIAVDKVSVYIKDGAQGASYEYITTYPLAFGVFKVCGQNSPEMMVYAAACSTTVPMSTFLPSMIGYLSC